MNINFKKYQRVFAFGCSFTNYRWPTWADLLSLECKYATYHNFARAGLGNTAIFCRLVEANKRFNFTNSDLILLMWSSFCREDRWLSGRWFPRGNVYNSDYPKEFVKNFTDPVGYLIRDHALINGANAYLNNLNCDKLILRSTPFLHTEKEFEDDNNYIIKQLEILYKADYEKMPIDYYTAHQNWNQIETKFQENGSIRHDGHPSSMSYYNYIIHLGISLSEKTRLFAEESDEIMSIIPDVKLLNEKYKFLKCVKFKEHLF